MPGKPDKLDTPGTTLRKPSLQDGAKIWALVKGSEPLELNPSYVYLLLCTHFPDTCVVAEQRGEMVGFLAAYRPPTLLGAIFVWQVAVKREFRGKGIASAMLLELLQRIGCRDFACYLEATVPPANRAAQALFQSLARKLGAQCEETPLFSKEMFGEEGHPEETLFIVGPFRLPSVFSAR